MKKKGPVAEFIEVMTKEHPVGSAVMVLFVVAVVLINPPRVGAFIGGLVALIYAAHLLFQKVIPWIDRRARALLHLPTPEEATETRRQETERRWQEEMQLQVRKLEEQLQGKVEETWNACWREQFLQRGDDDNYFDVRSLYFPMLSSERQLDVLVARMLEKDKAVGVIEGFQVKVDAAREALLKKHAKEIEALLNEPERREEIMREQEEWEYRASLGEEIRERQAEGKPVLNDDGKLMVVVLCQDGMYEVKPWWEVTDEDDVVEDFERKR